MTTFFLVHGSYFAIVLALLLTGAGLPIPEEIVIITAGVMASHGHLEPGLALLACMIGVLGGDALLYGIGRYFGDNLVRAHPYWARFVDPKREAQIEQMIHRHGIKVFLLTRFLVGLRSPVYLTTGILRYSFRRFFFTDMICATVVVGSFFLLSFRFGQTLTRWIQRAEILITAAVVLPLVAIVIYLVHRHRKQSRSPSADSVNELQTHTDENSPRKAGHDQNGPVTQQKENATLTDGVDKTSSRNVAEKETENGDTLSSSC